MTATGLAGAILAGGRSSRMEGPDKPLVDLDGKPLLQHVLDRLAPQVSRLALCVERPVARMTVFGVEQLPDPGPGHRGPLGGVLSAMRRFAASEPWLLVVPCDAPFLPLDLGQRLLARARKTGAPCVAVHWRGHRQPTFALWSCSLLERLQAAVAEDGLGGMWDFQDRCGVAQLEWPEKHPVANPPPFFNINDPDALDRARRWLAQEAHEKCSA
jgi:molybdopterin-guanine dinucleotide biosynthesis protein A